MGFEIKFRRNALRRPRRTAGTYGVASVPVHVYHNADGICLARADANAEKCSRGLQVFACLFSSFEEVLYLDADNVAARDPTYMFDNEEFIQHGYACTWLMAGPC